MMYERIEMNRECPFSIGRLQVGDDTLSATKTLDRTRMGEMLTSSVFGRFILKSVEFSAHRGDPGSFRGRVRNTSTTVGRWYVTNVRDGASPIDAFIECGESVANAQ